jgi:hypothetical protein
MIFLMTQFSLKVYKITQIFQFSINVIMLLSRQNVLRKSSGLKNKQKYVHRTEI